MKCQHCEKPATFHITELTQPGGPVKVHLCEEHARIYLAQETEDSAPNALASLLAKQLKLEQTAEQLATLDKKKCPVCGISFAEFRQAGRFGCAYDYVCFKEDLEPLLINIHGSLAHKGKRPARSTGDPGLQHRMLQLRRDMQEAISKERYERAGQIRDWLHRLENGDENVWLEIDQDQKSELDSEQTD